MLLPLASSTLCHFGDGRYYGDGDTWQLDDCTLCLCHQGSPLCMVDRCEPVLCHHPVIVPKLCCPICPGRPMTHWCRDDWEWLFAFLFPPIPIHNFATNSHSHGIPTGLFLFLPIPIPKQSFSRCGHEQYSELGSNEITFNSVTFNYNRNL